LRVEADLDPTNPDAARIISAMKRGDLNQMSFAFSTIKDNWSDDRTVRELREVQLFDVSVVTFPAYEETVAELRNASSICYYRTDFEVAFAFLADRELRSCEADKQPTNWSLIFSLRTNSKPIDHWRSLCHLAQHSQKSVTLHL
jgi:hypothetical protein